ncbi:MAG TPA: AI-2E family transporter [Caldilineaceae bacterium]|nr:AI-2E family transporter [Caldilineaceae bacterium]
MNHQRAAAAENAPPGGYAFPNWTLRQVIMGTIVALGVVLAFVLLYRFYMVVFIFFVAVALEVATRPVVVWLERRGLRRWMSVLLLYIILLAALIGLVWAIAPLLAAQIGSILEQAPDYYQQARDWLQTHQSRLLRTIGTSLPLELSLPQLAPAGAAGEAVPTTPWGIIRAAGSAFFVALAIFLLAFYWTLEYELVTRRLMLRIPLDRREQARALLYEMEGKIGGYFRGQAILCVIVGAVSILVFFLLGIPYALMLGLLMGVFEAIPVIGPTLGAIPALALTLATAPDKVLWVAAALVAIQVLENNLLVPRVMDESVGVNAIVSILAITAFGVLFGLGGAILAIPLAAIIQIGVNRALFNMPMPEEVVATPANGAGGADENGKRDRLTVLRMEAQALAQDVRKQARNADGNDAVEPESASEDAEDLIEGIAQDLNNLLIEMEGRP